MHHNVPITFQAQYQALKNHLSIGNAWIIILINYEILLNSSKKLISKRSSVTVINFTSLLRRSHSICVPQVR